MKQYPAKPSRAQRYGSIIAVNPARDVYRFHPIRFTYTNLGKFSELTLTRMVSCLAFVDGAAYYTQRFVHIRSESSRIEGMAPIAYVPYRPQETNL